MRIAVVAAAVCLSIVGLSQADDAKASMRMPTQIPAQGLGAALKTLAQARDIQVLYFSEAVKDIRTGGAVGELTTDEALTQLLSGTGLTYRYVSDKAITILPVSGVSAAAAAAGGAAPSQPNSAPVNSTPGDDKKEGKKSTSDTFRVAQAGGAQIANSSSVATQNEQESERPAHQLEQITVTAQRRSQRLEDVPVSMSVVTANEIGQRQLVGAEDYLRGLPGVNQASDLYGGAIIIRGIETHPSFQNYYTGATVATYFGETPTTGAAGLLGGSNVDIKLVDVERVEVLRGPQGTSFGDASLGGAVRVIPATPKLGDFNGSLAAGYSSTTGYGGSNYMTQGVINFPLLSDTVALRAVAYRFEDSGYYRNVAASDVAFQSAVVIPNGSEAFAMDKPRVGDSYASGVRFVALYKPVDDLKFSLSYLSQTAEIDGIPVATTDTYEQTVLQVPASLTARGQTGGLSDNNIRITNATIEYNLQWADLLGYYSDVTSGAESQANYTAYSIDLPIAALYDSVHREHVGEARLVTKLDGAWNGLIGVYYDRRTDSDNGPYYFAGNPANDPFAPGVIGQAGNQDVVSEVKQRAAYGEVSWKFLPAFTLTGGARVYHYDSSASIENFGFFGSGTQYGSLSDSGHSFRGSLSYKIEDSLIYATFSQGFRLGKVQAPLPAGICGTPDGLIRGTDIPIASTGETTSDNVNNYELGTKLSLLNRRLTVDAAVFHINWANIPIETAAPNPPVGCGIGYTANAGNAKSDGLELEVQALVTDSLRFETGGSYTNARLSEDVPALNAPAGTRLPGSSKINANMSLQYNFRILGRSAYVRADSIYVGPFYTTLSQGPYSLAGDYVKLDVSGRIVVANVDLDLFVHNVTNQDAFTLRDPFYSGNPYYGYRLRPRMMGFSATAHF
jgi:iron complex outermembrane receptor protein